jgi:hypothetical protein
MSEYLSGLAPELTGGRQKNFGENFERFRESIKKDCQRSAPDNPSRQEVLGDGMTMKIVSINNNPSACDGDSCIRPDVTDLNAIVANIDEAEGRNDALRAYIYALRDLQVAYNESSYADGGSREDKDKAIDKAQAAVNKAFDWLIFCEFSLNRCHPRAA